MLFSMGVTIARMISDELPEAFRLESVSKLLHFFRQSLITHPAIRSFSIQICATSRAGQKNTNAVDDNGHDSTTKETYVGTSFNKLI